MDSAVLLDEGPDWRWSVVTLLSEENRKPSRAEDREVKQAFNFYRRWNKCRSTNDKLSLKRDYPDLFKAYGLYSNWWSERWLIEAGLLANISYPELSQCVGYSENVIKAYENLFFDIKPKLNNKGYILNRILLPSVQRGLHGRDYDTLYKTLAYCAGWSALIGFIDEGKLSDSARDWIQDTFRDKLLKQGWVAIHKVEINNYNAVEITGLVLKLKEIETLKGGNDITHAATNALGALIDQCVTTIMPHERAKTIDIEPRTTEILSGVKMLKFGDKIPLLTGGDDSGKTE